MCIGTVPGRSSIHCSSVWDAEGRFKVGSKSIVVRYSFKPMLAVLALFLSRSATSVLRHKPVIPGFGVLFHFHLKYRREHGNLKSAYELSDTVQSLLILLRKSSKREL